MLSLDKKSALVRVRERLNFSKVNVVAQVIFDFSL